MNHLQLLQEETGPLRKRLLQHPVYRSVDSVTGLRIFMEHHVFAVWDFMSLLKRLQQLQTTVDVPWYPKPHRIVTRFINDIVLGEESDEDGRGGYISHFDLYCEAMRECGASTRQIDSLVQSVIAGQDIDRALTASQAEPSIAGFVRTTWSFIRSSKPHCIAAAFTFGREDLIPEMFRLCVAALEDESHPVPTLKYYLARHIDLDESTHAPMALKVIQELCGTDRRLWEEATEAVTVALNARLSLWDGIWSAIQERQSEDGEVAMSYSSGSRHSSELQD